MLCTSSNRNPYVEECMDTTSYCASVVDLLYRHDTRIARDLKDQRPR